jgi:tetratricopeptide (TPR) repeat protein
VRAIIKGLLGQSSLTVGASFWGVFSIDASSKESRKRGFDQIAKAGGLEPNERAAKTWLSSLEDPWLLLIDGVDDPKTSIDKYFPDGERGHVLITTRNPTHKVHGTVGSRSYHFELLEKDDASDLLLKAACEPEPWSTTAKSSAMRVAESLGFLPLALVHAGGTIKNGLCSLEDYIDFYTRSWQRIRRDRTSFGISQDDSDMNVYSSYEINYQALEAISTETANTSTETAKDAIELLKTFSFLHCEDMRLDILIRAAINPDLEQQQRKKEISAEKAKRIVQRKKPWARFVKEIALGILAGLIEDRGQAVLPAVLRSTGSGNSFDKDRLRRALNELTQMSLISHRLVSGQDSYSMHTLVHTWVRNRPRTSTAEQAVWCQAAATTLTQCILLPPLGLDESDEDFQRDLLPHVDHVLKSQGDVQLIIDEKRKSRRIPWPVATSRLDARKAIQMAKFSHVYSQCGDFDRAEKLQKPVRDFVCETLGAEHPYAMAITLALAGTYGQQSRHNEAADLQEQVLQACIASLGVEDRKTLKVMDTVGLSRCFQGRFKEALALHEKAVEGLIATAGENDEDTLLAINNLGQIHTRYFRFDKARELHEKALTGMQTIHGPTHLNTLSAMESLAMTYLGLGGDLLYLAQNLMSQVVEQRTKKLGKEQPYTLLAICNLARIRSALGYMDEAASLMRAALPIAERNLGENHFGTLAGKVHLARVVVRQKRYEEAEQIFLDVIQRQRYEAAARNGEHPDRIMAVWYLLQCYQEHGKIEDAMSLCREASEGLSSIGGQGHPFAQKLLDKEHELRSLGPVGNPVEARPL